MKPFMFIFEGTQFV